MLTLKFLILIFIVTALTLLIFRKKVIKIHISPVLITSAIISLVIGLVLILWQDSEISQALEKHKWPSTYAEIIDTKIIGERAFRPEISYKYEVQGETYITKTDLHISGFGNKRSRRDTARKIIQEYRKGLRVKIYYDICNPQSSYLRSGPYWSNYMKFGLGAILYGIGSFFLLVALLRNI
jgi:hypothetical protein